MAVAVEALSRAGAAAVEAAQARASASASTVKEAVSKRDRIVRKREGWKGGVRKSLGVVFRFGEARKRSLDRAIKSVGEAERAKTAAEAHEALVREVVDGGYTYTVEPHTRQGAWHDSYRWAIKGTNSQGEIEVLSTSTEQVPFDGPNMGIRQRHSSYEQVYYGSHGETRYTPKEAEARGTTIHSVLYPIYQAAKQP